MAKQVDAASKKLKDLLRIPQDEFTAQELDVFNAFKFVIHGPSDASFEKKQTTIKIEKSFDPRNNDYEDDDHGFVFNGRNTFFHLITTKKTSFTSRGHEQRYRFTDFGDLCQKLTQKLANIEIYGR